MESSSGLRCELRGETHFSGTRPQHLHFLLFADRDAIKVYQSWNSWAYYARSFTAWNNSEVQIDTAKAGYQIRRREGAWEENGPSTQTINKGDFWIEDIDLCDGTWRISPALPTEQSARLHIIGHFEHPSNKDALKAGVWTGKIESKPIDIVLEKNALNA